MQSAAQKALLPLRRPTLALVIEPFDERRLMVSDRSSPLTKASVANASLRTLKLMLRGGGGQR